MNLAMNRFSLSRMAYAAAPRQESRDEVVSRFAKKTGVKPSVASTFAKISAPENKHLFSAEAAAKAFAHVKVES